jgi:hypothetical protein
MPVKTATNNEEATRSILQLQRRHDELKSANSRAANEARALAAIDNTQLQEDIRSLERQLEEMRKREAQISAQRRETEKQLEGAMAKNQAAHATILALAAAKAKQEKATRKVIVTLKGQDETKSVVIVEINARKALVGVLSSDQQASTITAKEPKKLVALLMEHLAAFEPQKFDVLLLIKPSAFDYDKLVENLLDRGFRVGSEPLQEDRSAL